MIGSRSAGQALRYRRTAGEQAGCEDQQGSFHKHTLKKLESRSEDAGNDEGKYELYERKVPAIIYQH
jgi:hypothetical protein